MKTFNCTPYEIIMDNIIKSEGCYLFDGNGKKYMDLESGVWCTSIGHNHPSVCNALKNQMEISCHVGYRYSNSIVEQAADMVLNILGIDGGKCVFLSSGSEAVEFAVQAAKRIAGQTKPYVLYLDKYFLSSYGEASSRPPDEWIAIDAAQDDEQDWLKKVEALPLDKIGAFVFEPGNASGLVRLPSKSRIAYLAMKVKEHGGLIVVDEVTTGIGRTGKWFGFEHYDIRPDIVACGKGIGNGYPVSCVAMSDDLAEKLLITGFRYAQSHQNDPLGCAAICAVLSHIYEKGLIDHAAKMGDYFISQLAALKEKSDIISEIRGRGLMLALEISPDAPIEKIHRYLCKEGYLVGLNIPNKVLRIYPPLIIEQQMINAFVGRFERILEGF